MCEALQRLVEAGARAEVRGAGADSPRMRAMLPLEYFTAEFASQSAEIELIDEMRCAVGAKR